MSARIELHRDGPGRWHWRCSCRDHANGTLPTWRRALDQAFRHFDFRHPRT